MFGLGNKSKANTEVDRTIAKSVRFVKDSSGNPAVSLDKIAQTSASLLKGTESAGISLRKRGLAGIRAQVILALDHSGSMHYDYQSGAVQRLVEHFLGFGLQVDIDGEIPIIPFDDTVRKIELVNLHNYQDVVQTRIWHRDDMGTTNLATALERVREMAMTTDVPIFCAVVTDGNPDSQDKTTEIVCDLARYPVFLKFLALREVPYLNKLDDLGDDKRLLDNVDAKSFDNLNMTKEEFAEAMTDEWDSWVSLATKAGILTS